ncbi:MAG: TetR/AcrR family transcriptional regulator [Clostridia bacterium]|nr:TetR/AcrR family transcriptional regulator [Clostridia bacterium]
MKREYRNSARTKKMIRAAFVDLIDEKKFISNISVAELADRADIAKSTFYNHYDDIYAVADEILKELMDSLNQLIDAMDADHTSDYRVYIRKIFVFLKENEDIYRKVSDSPDAIFFIDRIKHIIKKKIFSNTSYTSYFANKEEGYIRISFLANACVDVMVEYFKGYIDMPLDALQDNLIAILDDIIK